MVRAAAVTALRHRPLWKRSICSMNTLTWWTTSPPDSFGWPPRWLLYQSWLHPSLDWCTTGLLRIFPLKIKRVKDRRWGQSDCKWCWLHKGLQPTDSLYIVLESLRRCSGVWPTMNDLFSYQNILHSSTTVPYPWQTLMFFLPLALKVQAFRTTTSYLSPSREIPSLFTLSQTF